MTYILRGIDGGICLKDTLFLQQQHDGFGIGEIITTENPENWEFGGGQRPKSGK